PWAGPAVATLYDLYELSSADTERSSVVYSGLSQAVSHAPAPRTLVWHAPVKSNAVDPSLPPRVAPRLAHLGRCALSQCRGLAPTPGGGGGTAVLGIDTARGRPCCPASSGPPFCHDGTERPIPRPTDATEQKTCYSGKQKRHMLKKLLMIN